MSMEQHISQLDTQRFGFKVAKIHTFDGIPLKSIQNFKKNGIKLVISRVLTSDIKLINQMEEAGFRLKDVQVTYNYNLTEKSLPLITNEIYKYRGFEPNDITSIVRIASESFRNYGHYSKNEKIEMAYTIEIYEDWAKRCCIDKNVSDHIIVSELDGNIEGFLSFKILTEGQSQYAVGVMGAVDKNHRKGGVFQNINLAGLYWAIKEGLKRVEHNVLITNFPVNKTYISLGFQIIRSEATFHCWLD
jgi:hypothetical protein